MTPSEQQSLSFWKRIHFSVGPWRLNISFIHRWTGLGGLHKQRCGDWPRCLSALKPPVEDEWLLWTMLFTNHNGARYAMFIRHHWPSSLESHEEWNEAWTREEAVTEGPVSVFHSLSDQNHHRKRFEEVALNKQLGGRLHGGSLKTFLMIKNLKLRESSWRNGQICQTQQ